ncbi:MAG: ABC transporter substrate-binding protein [Hyphomicrobiaceae bacterium]
MRGLIAMFEVQLRLVRAWRATVGMIVAVATMAAATAGTASAGDAAVEYMRRAANELINAQRQGSPEAFARVIESYGHVPAIGLGALGSYRAGLSASDRGSFYKGLARFIGRYAANEAPKYPVARAEFASGAIRDGRSVLVDSRIVLRDGSAYDVRWMLVPHGRSFKVRDAQVLGFWVSPFLQRLFENYIAENGGKVRALVIALSR